MIKLCSLLIFIAALFLSCISIGFGDIETCGGEKYTSESQICENDTLKNPCGEDYYDPKIKFCFEDNNIYDRCDGERYNPFDVNYKCEDNILKQRCGEDYYDPKIKFCFEQDNKIYDRCDGRSYNPLDTNIRCEDNILKPICGGISYESGKQFCQDAKIYYKCQNSSYDVLKYGCCQDLKFTLAIQECKNNTLFNKCKGELYNPSYQSCINDVVSNKEEFIDNRDGNVYKYVAIGSQVWMAENLRYRTSNSKCYDDNLNNCELYGALYDWNTAKTVCPSDWHLPNDAEWRYLAYGSGEKLKAYNDIWNNNGKGTDDFGFSALPSGRYWGNSFRKIGDEADFWSANATSYSSGYADLLFLSYDDYGFGYSYIDSTWLSVRCIKD